MEIIKELLPQIYANIIENNEGFKVNSIRSVNLLPNFAYPQDTIQKCNEEL